MKTIPAAVRAILACPRCRGRLSDEPETAPEALACDACGLLYPVEEGIPVLLVERAGTLTS